MHYKNKEERGRALTGYGEVTP